MVTDCACRDYCAEIREEAINIFYGTAFTLILASRYAIGCVCPEQLYESYMPRNIRDIGTQSNQPFFAISLPLLDFLAMVIEGCAKGECRDRSKGHRVSPDRSVLSRFVSLFFFSLFAFQLTLLFFYRFFFFCFLFVIASDVYILVALSIFRSRWVGPVILSSFFFFDKNFGDGKI